MVLLSEIYNVTLKRGIRGANKLGLIRPTIGEFFMTHKDFQNVTGTLKYTDDLCTLGIEAVDASSQRADLDRYAYEAFNDINTSYTTAWLSDYLLPETPVWISYNFGSTNKKQIQKYTVASTDRLGGYPTDWLFQGSNNNVDWITLDTQTNIRWSTINEALEFTFSNTTNYQYYRWYITDSVAFNGHVEVGQFEMMEIV